MIFFASPDMVNDPFDCNVVPNICVTKKEIRAFAKKEFPNMAEEKYASRPATGTLNKRRK